MFIEPGTATWDVESNVRSYCRKMPDILSSGKGSEVVDVDGSRYIDFLSGCGSLNYGHNPDAIREALLDYIRADGVCMSMDLRTSAKGRFLEAFTNHILKPRGLDYKLQFPGPTGANAIEAAVKIARKATRRTNVIAFTNAFHGCSLGALSLTGSSHHRAASSPLLGHVTRLPYDGYCGPNVDTADLVERFLTDPSSGCDAPAAIVLETIQGEGGLNTASMEWVRKIREMSQRHGALLIVDDIQAGCGRSGSFFSFETLGIEPDIVCLAKAISGFGLPMSLVLLKPEYDVWAPGEHNGTFRGNNHAFITAAAAIETFWVDGSFETELGRTADALHTELRTAAEKFGLQVKGRGLMLGLDLKDPDAAERVRRTAYRHGLMVELCGPYDEVLKCLPPLTVEENIRRKALSILDHALSEEFGSERAPVMRVA